MSENNVLRKIFGAERVEVTVDRRKLHSDQLNDLYSSPNIIWVIKQRRKRRAEQVTRVVEKANAHSVLVRKPEGRRPLGRPMRTREDNIKRELKATGWAGADWIGHT
jgi:hypothetical protein